MLTSNSSRNYVQQYFPNLDFTSIYPSATDAYNAVKNSEISIAIAQLITGTSFINSLSAAQAAQYLYYFIPLIIILVKNFLLLLIECKSLPYTTDNYIVSVSTNLTFQNLTLHL